MELSIQDREALSTVDGSLAESSEVTKEDLNKLTLDQLKNLKGKLPENSSLLAQLNNLQADVQNNPTSSDSTQQQSSSTAYDQSEIGGNSAVSKGDNSTDNSQTSSSDTDQNPPENDIQESADMQSLKVKIAQLESERGQKDAEQALQKKVAEKRSEGYTDLYILSRLMAYGVISSNPIPAQGKILSKVFGWNIIPAYNSMAFLSKKSGELNGVWRDALVKKLGTEEKYVKMLKEMIESTDTHLKWTTLNSEVTRLKGIDQTLSILDEIKKELQKNPIDHLKVSSEFEKYIRMSGQYIKLDDTARGTIKTDLNTKLTTLTQKITAAENDVTAKKTELQRLFDKNITTNKDIADLKIKEKEAKDKLNDEHQRLAVEDIQKSSAFTAKWVDTKALLNDARANPQSYVSESDTRLATLKSSYDTARSNVSSKTWKLKSQKTIDKAQKDLDKAEKTHTSLLVDQTTKWPKYADLIHKLDLIDATTDVDVKARLQGEFSRTYATVNPNHLDGWMTHPEAADYDNLNKIKKGDPGKIGNTTVSKYDRIAAVDRVITAEKAKNAHIDPIRTSLSLSEKADAQKLKWYVDEIHDKIEQINKLAQDKVTALSNDPKIHSAEEFHTEANKILHEANDLVEKYNKWVMKKYGDTTKQLTPLAKADLDKMLIQSTKAEKLMAANGWMDGKIMDTRVAKWAFGGMMLFALGQSGIQIGKWIMNKDTAAVQEGAVNLTDTAIGFIPVAWGAYDIITSAGFAVKWLATWHGKATDWNGKEMSWGELGTRVWFGVLGLIPYVGTVAKAARAAKLAEGSIDAAKAVKDIQRIDQVTEASKLTMKTWAAWMVLITWYHVLAPIPKWGYALATRDWSWKSE